MNRDDILRMALESGCFDLRESLTDGLERFAKLVAAAEREACARVCEELETISDAGFYGHEFSAAIRARGEE